MKRNPGVQQSNTTRIDRYPATFALVRRIAEVADLPHDRILSFGCSTGDEAHTLTTQYFEGAHVLGLDISQEALAEARAKYGDNPRLRFEDRNRFAPEPASFDIAFAMSVLCRWPRSRHMDDISELFPFHLFERELAYIDALLKPGALLIVHNANYSFLHSEVSAGYDLVLSAKLMRGVSVRRFGKDGLFDPEVSGADRVYRKRPAGDTVGRRGLRMLDERLQVIGLIERDLLLPPLRAD